jgi:glycosyltransferase involved in cell wall biosynthesis
MPRTLRIGIDGRGIYKVIDGIGRYSINLIRSLASIDSANEYFIFKNNELEQEIVDAPNFHEVSVNFRHLSLRTPFYLPFLTKKYRLDIFHAPFFIGSLWGIKNLILTVHDLMALTFPGFFGGRGYLKEKGAYWYHRVFVPLSIRKAKKIIAVSQSTKMDLMKILHIEPEKISVIHEAVDDSLKKNFTTAEIDRFKKDKRLPDRYVLYTGNMKPYKNIPLILSALEILKKKNMLKHKVVIAGRKDRFFPSLYEEVKDKHLLDDVIFMNYVKNDELPMLFKGADAFVFPSLSEGFGLPPLEAMSLGVPTIVSNISSLPEIAGNGAITIDPRNAENLAEAILRLMNDENFRRDVSRKGIERSQAFSWKKTAEETIDVYKSVSQK